MSNLYGLLDAAQDQRLYDLIVAEPEHSCLFAGDLHPDLVRASPHILHFQSGSKLLAEWLGEGLGKSWGIRCTSVFPLERVRRHFRQFLQAKLPDGKIVLFRFYDPRVWRTYLPTCSERELNAWFNVIDEYIAEDGDESELVFFTVEGRLQTRRRRRDRASRGDAPASSSPLE